VSGERNIVSILYPLYSGEMNKENRGIIDGQVATNANWPIKEFRNAKKILNSFIFKELRGTLSGYFLIVECTLLMMHIKELRNIRTTLRTSRFLRGQRTLYYVVRVLIHVREPNLSLPLPARVSVPLSSPVPCCPLFSQLVHHHHTTVQFPFTFEFDRWIQIM
jgi:hypothetical protein